MLTFPQLLSLLLMVSFFLLLSFSRSKPMTEGMVLVCAAHYLVINSICWNVFVSVTIWRGGEHVFRWTLSPWLPAVSFALGIVSTIAVLVAWIMAMRGAGRYSPRQRAAFTFACLGLAWGLVISGWTPVALQSKLDAMPKRIQSDSLPRP